MTISRTGLGERRKNKRVYARMITVDFDGEFYATRDWSLGGFLIDGYDGALEPAETVEVGLILEDGTRTYERTASASVVRTDREDQTLAAKFEALDDDALDMLDGWQSGRLRRRDDPTTH